MRSIVGLGNPGKKYISTRHNIGFEILDQFAEKNKFLFKASKSDYYYSEGLLNTSSKGMPKGLLTEDSHDFFLIKPITYMNLSGVAVLDFINSYPVNLEDILVVADDVNLPPGQIRLRRSGSDGGHNGIKSIIYQLQSDSFPRLRFGIGSDFEKGEMADFVLSKFDEKEFELIDRSKKFAVELIEQFIIGGYKMMLDHFSQYSLKSPIAENSNESDEIAGN